MFNRFHIKIDKMKKVGRTTLEKVPNGDLLKYYIYVESDLTEHINDIHTAIPLHCVQMFYFNSR